MGRMRNNRKGRKIEDIEAAFDRALGKDASILILKTLKLVYHTDKDQIVSNPAKFEKIMERMLGRSAYDVLKRNLEST
jgi:hypothetical protein